MNRSLDPDQLEVWQQQFAREGYLALPGYFSAHEIDAVRTATARALAARGMEIVVDSLETGERTLHALATNRDPIAFKFNDLYLFVEEVREMALENGLSELLRALLGGKRPVLCNSLTFEKGSGQSLHIDSLFMTPYTPGDLGAVWIAFEDVDAGAGPLEYYPGSQSIPLYRFTDGSHHANAEEMPAWSAYITAELERRGLEKKIFLARKGDVFIWHSDLVHGGSEITDSAKTRRSLVCHYASESDCRRIPDWKLVERNAGFWLDRPPQIVRPDPACFDADHPFPEASYLRRNPDLQGHIRSGLEHYRMHGYAEGRGI